MQKTKQTNTKPLVITITTAAIIAAVTTTSLSAATQAFAKINCKERGTFTVCSGGESIKNCATCEGRTDPGGGGRRTVIDEGGFAVSHSGGGGANLELGSGQILVGGGGGHFTTEGPDVAGSGQHLKGPGGNSGNVPP
jgi:hypothetical protein